MVICKSIGRRGAQISRRHFLFSDLETYVDSVPSGSILPLGAGIPARTCLQYGGFYPQGKVFIRLCAAVKLMTELDNNFRNIFPWRHHCASSCTNG